MIIIAAAYNFARGKSDAYKFAGITVDEWAISDLLRQSSVMETGKFTDAVNAARLKTATSAIKDRIFLRLAHFNNAKAQMDCDRKVKDIMFGVAEGLKDAGIITDEQYNSETDSIEAANKSALFPNLVPVNFCDLAK